MKTQFDEAEGAALTSDSLRLDLEESRRELNACRQRLAQSDLERFMAKRIGAQTKEIKASHAGFISQPAEIAKVIEAAAGAK